VAYDRLCTCELYYVPFRFLKIFTVYLWVGEEGGEDGGEGGGRGGVRGGPGGGLEGGG
jgi:hypothetical protein